MTEFIITEIQSHSLLGLLCLTAVFFYVGLITVGGGLVSLTVIQQVIVDNFRLLSTESFYNMVAISESTPGPIGINMATYVGTELYGAGGGIVTTVGEVMPSVICIILIARFFAAFADRKGVKAAFSTLRPAVSGVIAVAAVKVIQISLITMAGDFSWSDMHTWKNAVVQAPNAVFYLVALAVLFKTKIHPVFIVMAGGAFGVLFC